MRRSEGYRQAAIDLLRPLGPYARHAASAVASAVSVGLLLAIFGSLLPSIGVRIESDVYWAFGLAAALAGGNLIALTMERQERFRRKDSEESRTVG